MFDFLDKLDAIQVSCVGVQTAGYKIKVHTNKPCTDCSYGCSGTCSNRCAGGTQPCGTKGTGCFITTAVCQSFKKPDDCNELTELRKFRDEFMKKDAIMAKEVEEYYEIAPKICSAIETHSNNQEIYKNIWDKWLKDAVVAVETKENMKAYKIYKEMVLSLKREYLAQ